MTVVSDADLAQGRRLVADLDTAQWELGDLARRVAGPTPPRGRHDPHRAALNEFAEAIGIAPTRLAEYRAVASAWAPDERIEGASWTLHRGLVGRPDRAEHLAAFLAACRAEGVAPTRDRLRSWPPHPPRPDDRRTFRTPASIEEACVRLTDIDRVIDEACVSAVVESGLDPDDAQAVGNALANQASTARWPWSEVLDGAVDADDLADAWSALYARWLRRSDPVASDPWEDRS